MDTKDYEIKLIKEINKKCNCKCTNADLNYATIFFNYKEHNINYNFIQEKFTLFFNGERYAEFNKELLKEMLELQECIDNICSKYKDIYYERLGKDD
jgi:hypothetical protein